MANPLGNPYPQVSAAPYATRWQGIRLTRLQEPAYRSPIDPSGTIETAGPLPWTNVPLTSPRGRPPMYSPPQFLGDLSQVAGFPQPPK